MDLQKQIADAVEAGHPLVLSADEITATTDAVMEVVEGEQKHARADALYWAARELRKVPMPTALTGPYWYGAGWKEAADHLMDLAEWEPSDGEAERTYLAARVRELEDEKQRMRDDIAARIVEEECTVQQRITEEPLNSWLAGLLFGLQRARDIALDRTHEITEEET